MWQVIMWEFCFFPYSLFPDESEFLHIHMFPIRMPQIDCNPFMSWMKCVRMWEKSDMNGLGDGQSSTVLYGE